MANQAEFDSGYQQGYDVLAQKRAHKQALSDQQFQEKHNEIQGMIENLHDQLTAVPKDQRNTPDYLKMQDQLAQAIQDRNAHWKSVDQPNALSKFGKMLGKDLRFKKQEAPIPVAPPVYGQPTIQTPASQGESTTLSGQPAQPASDRVDMVDGHLKATRDPGSPALPASTVSLGGSEAGPSIPAGPAYKVQGPQTPAQVKAAAEAAKLVAAGPVSPEQAATQQGKAESAKSLAEFQGKLKLYDQNHPEGVGPNATPEGKQARQDHINELINSTSGVKEPKEPVDAWTAVKGVDAQKMPDGSYRELQVNKKGEYRYQQMPEGYNPQAPKAAKPGTSVFSVSLDTYAKSKGYGSFSEIPDEYKEKVKDYEIRKGVLDRTISRKSIVTRVMQDAEGHPFTATVTNYSGPAGNEELVDPMPLKKGDTNPPDDTGKPTPNPTPVTPKDVKDKAKKINPQPSGGGNAKFGPPDTSIQMKTPEITAANKLYQDAVGLVDYADKVQKNPNNAQEQRDFAIKMEKVMSGRFQTAAYDLEVKNSGIANTFQQWVNDVSTGALPKKILDNLVQSAHDYKDAMAKEVEAAKGKTPNAGGATPDAAAKSLADRLHEAYGAK